MTYYSSVRIRQVLRRFSILIFLSFTSFILSAFYPPVLLIKGFKNQKGNVMIRVTDEKGKVLESLIKPVSGTEISIPMPFLTEDQRFAIEVFHDENSNRKLDKALLGYPVESWGVSNNVRPGFRAPTLDEMLTRLTKSQEIIILVK